MNASTQAFLALLDRCVTDSRVGFRIGDGVQSAGAEHQPPDVVVQIRDESVFARALTHGNLGLAEAYMDGQFEMERGSLCDFLTILLRNRLDERIKTHPRLAMKVMALQLRNKLRGRQTNVRRHYDIGIDLFESFLDETMTYSCGYASHPDDSLEALQHNKFDRICRKLRLQPGMRLLDIGCGFGGLLVHAAREHGVTAVGVTNSRSHWQRGSANVSRLGLAESVRLELSDYSCMTGTFDRIVSVGMLEHVPRRQYRQYFRLVAARLGCQGIGLVHAIGCNGPSNTHDPFTQRYVFPGSSQPKLSEIASHLERNGLAILDVENIVRHYGYTVRRWLERFRERQSHLDSVKYDRRFQRMWEYYLSCGIAAATASQSAVYQVLFTNDYTLDIPLSRV